MSKILSVPLRRQLVASQQKIIYYYLLHSRNYLQFVLSLLFCRNRELFMRTFPIYYFFTLSFFCFSWLQCWCHTRSKTQQELEKDGEKWSKWANLRESAASLCTGECVRTLTMQWLGQQRDHTSPEQKSFFISRWKELGRILQQNTRLKQLPFHVTQYRKKDVVQSHV